MSNVADRTQKETTRARVVELLRSGQQTVDELARALGLTDNAVRMHLAGLEREGIVRQFGVRRSGTAGKPAVIYEIAAEAEPLFSRAYAPVLATLVDVLAERLGADTLSELMREVGHRVSSGMDVPAGPLPRRARTVAALLDELGALTTVDTQNGSTWIRGAGCPLGAAVAHRPEVCQAVEQLLVELTGAAVQSHCRRDARPSCCFELRQPE